MKYVWFVIFGIFVILSGLFLFQNQSRVPSTDSNGLQLSLDLGFWGVGTSHMSISLLVALVFGIGLIVGLLLPFVYKAIKKM